MRLAFEQRGGWPSQACASVIGDTQLSCIPPGWIELTFEGLHCDGLFHPKLNTTYLSGSEAEYVLPPAAGDFFKAIVFASEPIKVLKLGCAYDGQPFTILSCRVVRLGALGVLRRSLQLAFTATLVAAFWALLGKKLRARNRFRRILSLPPATSYPAWLSTQEMKWKAEIPDLLTRIESTVEPPRFGVLMDRLLCTELSQDTLRSLRQQSSTPWEFVQVGEGADIPALDLPESRCRAIAVASKMSPGERLHIGLEAMAAEWVIVLRNGDQLAHGSLARLADAAMMHPFADVIYGDHDLIDESGRRHSPQFKPDWNPPLFHAYDYIGGALAFRREKALAVDGFKSGCSGLDLDDLLLRLAALSAQVVHIPRILFHRSSQAEAKDFREAGESRCRMLRDLLASRGDNARVELDRYAHARVLWDLPKPEPLVSLIVPTRDRVDLLRPCIESLRRTTYTNLEILILDNGSRQRRTRSYFSELSKDARVRILERPAPFNFAALNNAAVRFARGSIVGFINNDVEVIEPEWLSEMVRHAVLPEIGAVGALLLYPGGNVQHAGVIVGLQGLAGHAHRFFPAEHLGYMRRLQSAQYMTAVTAACLLIERRKFDEVAGFDEVGLPVALNDVDLCLKLDAAGYRNFYTPYAKLLHKESASRAWDLSRARREAYERECANFKARWAHMMNDRYYNPNLTQTTEDFALL